MDNQLVNEVVEEKQEKIKKPSKVVAIIISIAAFITFLAVQTIVSMVAGAVKGAQLFAEVNGDMDIYMQKYQEVVQSPSFLTPVLTITEIVLIIIGVLWYVLGYANKKDRVEKKAINKKVFTFKTLITCIFLAFGFYAIDSIIANIVALISPSAESTFSDMMNMVFDLSNPVSFLVIAVIGPIAEELFFRGVVLNALRKSWSKWPTIIISALLFAGMHLVPMQVLYAIPIALIMGYVAYEYKSLLPTIVIHIVNNTVASLVPGMPEAITSSYVFYVAVAVVCIVIAVILNKEAFFKKNA